MAKILTDAELKDIIRRAVDDAEIDCSDAYTYFLEDLGDLIAKHFGGTRGNVEYNEAIENNGVYTIAFHLNECVPADGGIYKQYDTDVTWKDNREE